MKAIKSIKDPIEGRKSNIHPLPLPVARAIAKLGGDIALARRRRRITQLSLADRIGASLNTVKRLEAGDMRVPLHFVARTLYVLGGIERLSQLLDTGEDAVGLSLMDEALPKRIRTPKAHPAQGAM